MSGIEVRSVCTYRHLQSHNIDCEIPKVAPYGWKQLYLHDPDGYSLCFQYPEG